MPDGTTSQMPSHSFLLSIFAGSLLTGTIAQVLAAEAGETANRPNILFIMADDHTTQAIGDVSLEWLRNGRDKSKPFFLMHHFKAPHDMFSNARRYDSYLAEVGIPKPDNILKS